MIIQVTEKVKEALSTELFRCFQNAFDYRDGRQMGDYRYAWEYYHGFLPLPPTDKASSVPDRTVMSNVNGIMQEMLSIFTTGEAVKFIAESDRDAEQARAATQIVNHILLRQNDGYNVLSAAFKESLVGRNSFVKCWWRNKKLERTDTIRNLINQDVADIAVQAYVDAGAEIIKENDLPANPDGTFDREITYTMTEERVAIENVPFEEIIFEQQAKSIEDCNYFCHMAKLTKATLLDLGYPEDRLDEVTFTNNDATTQRSTMWSAAFARTGGRIDLYQDNGQDSDNGAARACINEHYFRTDALNKPGDKTPHLYMIHEVNENIFRVEEIDDIPFETFTPVPIPNSIYGESITDFSKDIQDQKAARRRGVVDNINNANHGRYVAIKGAYNRRDILNNEPGGIIEIDRPDALNLLPYHPLPNGIDMYAQELEQDNETRTGVSRVSQALEKEMMRGGQGNDALNTLISASQGRIRMYAMNYAHGGVSRLMKRIYSLYRENGKTPISILTASGTQQIQPIDLPAQTNVEVNVYVSATDKAAEAGKVSAFIAMVMQAMQAGADVSSIVGSPQWHYLITKGAEALGWKNTQDFVIPIDQMVPSQPDPLKAAQAAQAQAQAAASQAQAKLLDAQSNKLFTDAQIEVQRLEFDQQKAADETQFNQAELQFRQEVAADEQMNKEFELNLKHDEARSKAVHQDQQNANKDKQITNDAVVKQAKVVIEGRKLEQSNAQ